MPNPQDSTPICYQEEVICILLLVVEAYSDVAPFTKKDIWASVVHDNLCTICFQIGTMWLFSDKDIDLGNLILQPETILW